MLANYKEALNDARKSIELDSKFEKGFLRVAKCCLLLGDLVQTEQTIKKFLEIDPRNTALKGEIQNLKQLRTYEEKAHQCYGKQDYRTCLFHVESALKIAQASQRLKLLKAECLVLLGRVDEANDIAIGLMKIDSNNSDAIYVRGLTLYYSDNLDKSIMHFERTLQLDPDHKKAKLMRTKSRSLKEKKEQGNEFFKAGKYREALAIYTEALNIDPLNKEINSKLYYNRALVNTKVKLCNLFFFGTVKTDFFSSETFATLSVIARRRSRSTRSTSKQSSSAPDANMTWRISKRPLRTTKLHSNLTNPWERKMP